MKAGTWWFLLGLVVISNSTVQSQAMQSTLTLQSIGTDFYPANPIELIAISTDIDSFLSCYVACNINPLCRTFVSDTATPFICRLYQGSIDTGTVIASSSSTLRVGGLHYDASLYVVYNEVCDPHIPSFDRYLICVNRLWQCPSNTYWNDLMCLNQVYYGESCMMNEACRQDIGLQCSSVCHKCLCNLTASWNSTSCVVTQTSCSSSSLSDSTVISFWPMNGNVNDLTNRNNGTLIGNATFVSGYIDLAIQCSDTAYIQVPFIDFYRRSFTIELWLYRTNNTNVYMGIIGECMNTGIDNCLHFGIQIQSLLYMAFNGYDIRGSTIIVDNKWYHVAFVYDYAVQQSQIYLNGLPENSISIDPNATDVYLGQSGRVTIGRADYWTHNWVGYIDQVSITYRAKSANEILDDATLIAYYSFDCGSIFDSGPNLLQTIANGQTMVTGRVKDAILFNLTNAYFQTSSFMMFGITNQSFSIALWVKPWNLSGILVHISNQSTGDGWCMPLLGFNSSGMLIAQVSSFIISEPAFEVNVWTHIVQTFSTQNDLQLYINGTLRQKVLNTTTAPPHQSMYITVARQQLGNSSCMWGGISPSSYMGAIDELRIYNREITTTEICGLSS
ncbi:unnamed protein product [Adineta steineri]|uniref:LamG-like jellyroll fold domain-containing protein n=2 Tax=Adineta steineri TaxID=433720 RepID=A0A819ZE49_9BILA|nr:unnamed protein product [Adineta steineri]